jgi:hypothetical protein
MNDDRGTDKDQLTQRERLFIEALIALAERKIRELEKEEGELEKDTLHRLRRFLLRLRAKLRSSTKRRNRGSGHI